MEDVTIVYDYTDPRVYPNYQSRFKPLKYYYQHDPDNQFIVRKLASFYHVRGDLSFIERNIENPPTTETLSTLPVLTWKECYDVTKKGENMTLHEQSRLVESVSELMITKKHRLYTIDLELIARYRNVMYLLSLFTENPGCYGDACETLYFDEVTFMSPFHYSRRFLSIHHR